LILKSWLIPSWVTVFILTGTGFSTFVLMLVAVERKTLLTEGRIFLLSVFRR
jgi:hypothetical protein